MKKVYQSSHNIGRERNVLNHLFLKRTSSFSQIHDATILRLSSAHLEASLNQHITNVAFFSSAYTLLGDDKKLLALINDILLQRLTIKTCPLGFYIELFEHDARLEQITLSHPFRLFLDATTHIAIRALVSQSSTTSKPLTRITLWKIIVQELSLNNHKVIRNLKAFCQSAVAFNITKFNSKMPMWLYSYSTGNITSYCACTKSFERLFNVNIYDLGQRFDMDACETEFFELGLTPPPSQKKPTKSAAKIPGERIASVCLQIKRCFIKDSLTSPSCNMLSNLINLKSEMKISQEIILVAWFINLLRNKHPTSTVKRYYYAVAEYWLLSLQELCIEELDQQEVTEIRDEIENFRPEHASSKNNLNVLNQLMQFAAENYNIAPPLQLETKGPNVRNYLISEHDYNRAFNQLIGKIEQAGQKQLSLCILFLLMGRCGLRPSEAVKLRLSDIELSEELHLYVRPNVFGKNKTYCAKRQIPVAYFLKPNELSFFKQYLNRRIAQSNTFIVNHLFAPIDIEQKYPFSLSELDFYISRILTNVTETRLVSYHLRHMAISNLQITLFGEKISSTYPHPFDEYQRQKIRSYIDDARQQNTVWNIAGFAGHLSPNTTFGTYLHNTGVLLGSFTTQLDFEHSKIFWCNVSEHSKLTLARRFNNEDISAKKLEREFYSKSQPLTDDNCTVNAITPNQFSLKSHYTYSDCIHALKAYDKVNKQQLTDVEKAKLIQDISQAISVPESQITAWINSAKLLNKLHTEKGSKHRRLFPKNSNRLCPIEPHTRLEKARTEKMFRKLRMHYVEHKKDIIELCKYLLKNTQYGHSYLKFCSIADYQNFISTALLFSEASDWKIEIDYPIRMREAALQWKQINRAVNFKIAETSIANRIKFPVGRAKLYLLQKPSNQSLSPPSKKPRYSSNVMKHICHVLGIMLAVEV